MIDPKPVQKFYSMEDHNAPRRWTEPVPVCKPRNLTIRSLTYEDGTVVWHRQVVRDITNSEMNTSVEKVLTVIAQASTGVEEACFNATTVDSYGDIVPAFYVKGWQRITRKEAQRFIKKAEQQKSNYYV